MQARVGETESAGRAGRAQLVSLPPDGIKLNEGDVVVAAVERIEGNAMTLRLNNGILLHAILQAEISLKEGDSIEALAGRSGESLLLHVLDVSRAGYEPAGEAARAVSQPLLSGMLATLKRNIGMEPELARFLTENNIPDTPENVTTLRQMSENAGIGTLLVKILGYLEQPEEASALKTMPGNKCTEESAIYNNVNNDDNLSENVNIQLKGSPEARLKQAVSEGTTPEKIIDHVNIKAPDLDPAEVNGSSPGETEAGRAYAQNKDLPTARLPSEGSGRPGGGEALDQVVSGREEPTQEINGQAQSAAPLHQDTNAPLQARRMNTEQSSLLREQEIDAPVPVLQMNLPEQEAVTGTEDAAKAQNYITDESETAEFLLYGAYGKAQTSIGEEEFKTCIGDLIRSILVRPDALTGSKVKKTVIDMPEIIKTLKSLLVQSDIKNKEQYLKSFDQALRQTEMAGRDARFEHIQIPILYREGEGRTAELFVFRRKTKPKESGSAGTCVLLALDTQYIGRVETLIRETGGNVSLEFRLEQEKTADEFKRNGESIENAAQAAGYCLTAMRFAGLEKETTILNAGELAPPEEGIHPQGIDIKI